MDAAPQSETGRRFSMLPSAAVSLLLHVVVLLLAGTALRGCQKTQVGESGGAQFRDVGLFVVEGSQQDSPNSGEGTGLSHQDSAESTETMPQQPMLESESNRLQQLVPSSAPDIQSLLADQASQPESESENSLDVPSVIGIGQPLSAGSSRATGGGLISPSAGSVGQQAVGTPQTGPGQTAFMNITDSGSSFVYVIDVSASMGEDNRLQVAKSQLKASLRLLQPNQQFQVIFYSEFTSRIKLKPVRNMYFATTANVLRAVSEVDRVQPDRGTEHKPALVEALSLEPDVIYFLTDGREQALSPADLRQIRLMAGGTTVHVIEFGSGLLEDRSTSWLERLARQSNGEYRMFGSRGR